MSRASLVAAAPMSVLLAVGTVYAQPQTCPSSSGRSVAVTGSGVLRVPPDRVSFSVGVETVGLSIPAALQENTEKVRAVVTALNAAGVVPAEIQTTDFSIRERDETGDSLPGFLVQNTVTVTRTDPKGVGDLIQAAVDAGANRAHGPRFYVADSVPLRDRGFELAFRDAQDRASKLASLSGGTLGEVICVAHGGYAEVGGLYETIMVAASPLIETGLEELSFNVSVVFELK